MKRLSISNIGWDTVYDEKVYLLMQEYGFEGLEIAPTRIFPNNPYSKLNDARNWSKNLKQKFGFTVPSMQSIWYGRTERLFGTEDERNTLINYTKQAIDFASEIGCRNLVFGCPKNRICPEGADFQISIDFFREIGEYAFFKGTAIGMEANPTIYNTNYINDTAQALELIEKVNSKGFLLNLDVGTMLYNNEPVNVLKDRVNYINHVHISEPGLKPIKKHSVHNELMKLLKQEDYDRFVSIEMGKVDQIDVLESTMDYVRRLIIE